MASKTTTIRVDTDTRALLRRLAKKQRKSIRLLVRELAAAADKGK